MRDISLQRQAQNKDSHSNLLEADEQIVSSNTSAKFEVVNLTCIRDNRCLFSGLSFFLSPGQLIQVDGPNGSGKTSLLRLACGLSTPESGEIKWNGEEIQEIRSRYMANIAYLGHVHGVKSELTALENLQIDWVLKQNPLQLAPMNALERVGLAGFEDIPCRILSAGQKRRVALSRLLISATILWILDEPPHFD